MTMATTESKTFAIALTQDERAALLNLLERSLRDTHLEARRTESPDFQQQIHDREALLARLIVKLLRTQRSAPTPNARV